MIGAAKARAGGPCPCHSGRKYAECCRPLHEGGVAETPEALMRSRYAGFALGLGPYLVKTLARGHEDRAAGDDELARELASARETQRFLGLTIHGTWHEGDDGEVLFIARIFERGKDGSFAELSRFIREDGEWRYASATFVDIADVKGRTFTRDDLQALRESPTARRGVRA